MLKIDSEDSHRVTDATLAHLQELTELRSLHLPGSQVTDAGLVHLGQLTQLQVLYLGQNRVTDAGLAHLADSVSSQR